MFNVSIKNTSHHSICRICHKNILKGEEQVSANLGSGYFYYNYHLRCFIKRYSETIMKLSIDVISNDS